MKSIADETVEWVQAQPLPSQILFLQRQDPDVLRAFYAFVDGAQTQLVGRFLTLNPDLLDLPLCAAEEGECGERATGVDETSGPERLVCDRHGAFAAEPRDRAS